MSSLSSIEQKAVAQFKREVLGVCGTDRPVLCLFGSRARGEGNEDSDVDVLVVLPREDEKRKIRIWDVAYHVFDKTGIQIAPFVLSKVQFENLKSHERLIAREIE